MEFLKQVSAPCGGTVLEHTNYFALKTNHVMCSKSLLQSSGFWWTFISCHQNRSGLMQNFQNVHTGDIMSTPGILNPLPFNTSQSFNIHLLQCFSPLSTGHGGKRLNLFPDLPVITGRCNRKLYQKVAKPCSLQPGQLLPVNFSE